MQTEKHNHPKSAEWHCCLGVIVILTGIIVGLINPGTAHAQDREEDSPDDVTTNPLTVPPEQTAVSAGEQSETNDESPQSEITTQAVSDPWESFFPPPDPRFDWIQLISGEWLKGEIKGLYNFKLEFESDELDSLSFDWDDVKAIRSAGAQAVRYDDFTAAGVPLTAFGRLTLIGGTATIGTGPEAKTINRNQIITIATGSQKEVDFWSGELSIGANLRGGNSDVADAAVTTLIERRKAESRFHADYRGNFSRTSGVETQNNHRINSWFDSFRTSRWYWRVVFAQYFRDRFQNIKHQLGLGTGAGYDLIRNKKTEWDISAGVGALYKEAVSVERGDDAGNTSPALSLGTSFDTELTKRLDYYFRYNVQVVDEENGSVIHNLVTTLSSDFIGDLDLDLTLTWDRIQDPQPAADGRVPKQDDYRFTVAIKYEF